MSPKEKAINLRDKFMLYQPLCADRTFRKMAAMNCALLSVEEIINTIGNMEDDSIWIDKEWNSNGKYWQEVKKEIELL